MKKTILVIGAAFLAVFCFDIWALSADSESLYVSDTGKVGIGTTSPETKLQVQGGTDVSLSGGGFIVSGSLTATNIGTMPFP